MSSSPPFPRYERYGEVATGATTRSGHAESKQGLAKNKTQGNQLFSLPMRPTPARTSFHPARVTGLHGGPGGPGGTAEWINSAAGKAYLAKHQLHLPPTQLLSLECQKRKFNPEFAIEQVDGRTYQCRVTVRDVTVRHRGHYPNGVAAKQDLALKALKVVQEWPVPRRNLYFIAQFSGKISDDAVHTSLRKVLKGREYELSTLRYPGMSGGSLLLQIPERQGFPTSIVRLEGALNSVVFVNIKKTEHCNLCDTKNPASHSRVYCPLWRHSAAPPPVQTEFDGRRRSFSQHPIKTEPEPNNPPRNRDNRETSTGRHADMSVDKQNQLIRTIQDVMGTVPASSESQDPKVKAAFLEGVALGARLAGTAPADATNNERRRSQSPGPREPRHSDHWQAPGYRDRSPLPVVRDRQRSREPTMEYGMEPLQRNGSAPFPLVRDHQMPREPRQRRQRARSPPFPLVSDRQLTREPMMHLGMEPRQPVRPPFPLVRGTEPQQAAVGLWGLPRGRRPTPESYFGQGNPHWDSFLR